MTTADDFVIQFIQDKGLVSSAQVSEAREALGAIPDGQNPDLGTPLSRRRGFAPDSAKLASGVFDDYPPAKS